MRKVKVNEQYYLADDLLEGFTVCQQPSSNVVFFGENGSDVFAQFKNGGCYIYKGVIKEHIEEMYAAESIGKFFSALGKQYHYAPIQYPLVTPVSEPAKQ